MSTLDNGVEVVWVVVTVVFLPVLSHGSAQLVLNLVRYRVLRRVHVGYLGILQTARKLFPRLHLDLIVLAYVQTPDVARGHLQNSQESQNLLVTHSLVEILR